MRLRSTIAIVAVALLALGSLLTLVRQHGYLQFLELAAYDLLVANVGMAPATPAVVTLVLVGEQDIQRLGNWPLTDAQLHDILQQILQLGPRVVGVDIYRDLAVPPGHDRLHRLLRDESRIVGIEKFPSADAPGIPAPEGLQDTGRVGFSDLVGDPGGVVRRSLLFLSEGDRTGYSLSLQLALYYLQTLGIYPAPDAAEPSHMRLGTVTFVPLDGHAGGYVNTDAAGYQVMLDYRGGRPGFGVFDLGALQRGAIDAARVRDGIVILGVAAASVKDEFPTPFAIVDRDAGKLAGSLVHAHATQQFIDAALLGRQPLRWWSERQEIAYLWLWLVLGFLAGLFAGPSWRFALTVAAGCGAIASIAAIGYASGWWIPSVPGLVAWFLAAITGVALLAARRRRDQQALMSLFSRHVSPEVANTIWKRRDEVLVNGRIRPRTQTVTTLFSDLQGFTQVSEEMEPEPFLRWLNSYMARLTDTIMQHGGVLDDYAGDGIKASFGIPFCDPSQSAQQARRAIECALAMHAVLTELNRQWKSQGHACMAMRVGIHTGPVVVGTVGSASRMKYTTVGRNVNLASRLECLKDFPCPDPDDECGNCRILLSEDTAALTGGYFEMSDVGRYDLKGIREKVRVFAIETKKSEEQHHAQIQHERSDDPDVADPRHADGARG